MRQGHLAIRVAPYSCSPAEPTRICPALWAGVVLSAGHSDLDDEIPNSERGIARSQMLIIYYCSWRTRKPGRGESGRRCYAVQYAALSDRGHNSLERLGARLAGADDRQGRRSRRGQQRRPTTTILMIPTILRRPHGILRAPRGRGVLAGRRPCNRREALSTLSKWRASRRHRSSDADGLHTSIVHLGPASSAIRCKTRTS
ncbi:hypothetical protein LXA43DRAFT_429854 [Ganoderma leucocontextum]|nr:hypothetical protein LXA43DRAFT_429854 [Ganoderma leucocontextum]